MQNSFFFIFEQNIIEREIITVLKLCFYLGGRRSEPVPG